MDKIFSKPIVKCIDYIYKNLNIRITVTMLAKYIELHPSYLSKFIKKETGISISMYIQKREVETALNMLKDSDYSPAQIASILAFRTQSYFIEVFILLSKEEVSLDIIVRRYLIVIIFYLIDVDIQSKIYYVIDIR